MKHICLPNGDVIEDRRINGSNKNDKNVWWLMGILGVLISGGAMAWMTSINNLTLNNTQQISSIQSTVSSVDKRLTRIEDKLDKAVLR